MSESSQVKMAMKVVAIKEEMPAMLELISLRAKMQFAEYTASIKEGFTPEQALALVLKGAS